MEKPKKLQLEVNSCRGKRYSQSVHDEKAKSEKEKLKQTALSLHYMAAHSRRATECQPG